LRLIVTDYEEIVYLEKSKSVHPEKFSSDVLLQLSNVTDSTCHM